MAPPYLGWVETTRAGVVLIDRERFAPGQALLETIGQIAITLVSIS
jgi:hypothetical protein